MDDLRLAIVGGTLLGFLHGVSASAVPVTPNFTTGTMTSHSTQTTTVSESIRQIDYHVGSSYTATGTNIDFTGRPGPSAAYTIQTPGEPFQFTETHFTAGISRMTEIDRTTTISTMIDTVSVFSQ